MLMTIVTLVGEPLRRVMGYTGLFEGYSLDIHIHIHIHIHTYVHTYIHTYTHLYICVHIGVYWIYRVQSS